MEQGEKKTATVRWVDGSEIRLKPELYKRLVFYPFIYGGFLIQVVFDGFLYFSTVLENNMGKGLLKKKIQAKNRDQ